MVCLPLLLPTCRCGKRCRPRRTASPHDPPGMQPISDRDWPVVPQLRRLHISAALTGRLVLAAFDGGEGMEGMDG